ncbi:MAG TPA: hypothetical protein VL588_10945 [Bdellovibrionota bacterium]|nr:hypothetical protein [Bdellovibrionota bacterium]
MIQGRGLARLCWVVGCLWAAQGAVWAAEPGNTPSPGPDPHQLDDELPQIEAKAFATFARRRSQSLRVYVLEAKEYMPHVGRIVLLKRESANMMAFRVIKTYPDQQEFAARKVKEYEDRSSLPLGEAYMAIEKLKDVGMPATTEEDKKADAKDLKELEQENQSELPSVKDYDPDLDTGTSPPPVGAVDDESSDEEVDRDDSDLENLAADEVKPMDPDSQWLTGEFGMFKNTGSIGGTDTYVGGGARYGLTLGKMIFLASNKAQDALAVEAGAFLYKILGTSSETFTVMPVTVTGRYHINVTADLGLFFYFGINMNLVIENTGGTQNELTSLATTLPAGGGGITFRIGPKWHIRADIGIDMIGAGLMLRF